MSSLIKNIPPSAVKINCGGNPLDPKAAEMLTTVMIESRLFLPASFAVTLADSELKFIDAKGPLCEGVLLEINLDHENKTTKLFMGEISTVEAEMSEKGTFVRVAGYDLLHRLARGTNFRYYENSENPPKSMSDSSIAEALISAAGLTANLKDSNNLSIPRSQDNCSDLEFLTMLARLNGYYLYCEDKNIYFSDELPARDELTYTWGEGQITAFYPRLSLNGIVKTVENKGRDISLAEYAKTITREDLAFLSADGQSMLNRGSGSRDSQDRSVLNLHNARINDDKGAESYLKGVMRDRQALVSANGSCKGNPKIKAGASLKIEKAGRFSGSYHVVRAVHRFNDRGYTTDFELRMKL